MSNKPIFPTPSFAPWWTMCLARLFGAKRVGYDSGYKTTMYAWRGRLYVWSVKLDLLDD